MSEYKISQHIKVVKKLGLVEVISGEGCADVQYRYVFRLSMVLLRIAIGRLFRAKNREKKKAKAAHGSTET